MLLTTSVNAQTPESKETKEVKVVKKTTETTGTAIENQENELKNFRFGLVILPSLKWYSTESKIIQSDGISPKFGGGLIMEFRLAKVAALQTGINIVTGGGKLKYNNGGHASPGGTTIRYYFDKNADDIVESQDVTAANVGSHTLYQLNKRKYKATYISVPLLLKLKTREIGNMVYYGEFGLSSYFRWKGRSNDEVIVLDAAHAGSSEMKNNLMISKDVSIYTAALNFGLGTEWNLAGTTSLLLGMNFNLGFTNALRKNSKYLQKRFNYGNYDPDNPITSHEYTVDNLEQTIKENSLVLSVGFLF